MTESQFIEQNKEKWAELELLLTQPKKDADRLQELFVKVSSDLSYARTFYPKRSVRLYLNNLTQKVFDSMGKKKSGFKFKSILDFFSHSLPQEAYRQRNKLLLSFVIFAVSMLIGVISTANNPEFAKIILGESYISATDENINKGDPMAIYKDDDAVGMFEYITINNVRVAFTCFVLGLLGGIGTTYILISNGIMVGVFQYYFYSKGLFLTSFLTIWIHGTIEILSIIIAGAAGLVLGSGLLFPGTYKRSTALQISAKRSLRLLLGTVPLFIIAGLLESFVTRLTDLPMVVKIFIIAFSLLFVLGMFVFYPFYYNKYISPVDPNPTVHVQNDEELVYERYMLRSIPQNLSLSFAQFRSFFAINLTKIVLPGLVIFSGLFYILINRSSPQDTDAFTSYYNYSPFSFSSGGIFTAIVLAIILSICICFMELFLKNHMKHVEGIVPFLKKQFLFVFIINLLIILAYFQFGAYALLGLLILPLQSYTALLDIKFGESKFATNTFSHNMNVAYSNYFQFLLPLLIAGLFYLVILLICSSWFVYVITELIQWHGLFDNYYQTNSFIQAIVNSAVLLCLLPLCYFLFNNFYYSAKCKKESIDLQSRLASFGEGKKVFE